MTQMVNGRLRHFTRYNIRIDRQESGENKLILVGDQRQRKEGKITELLDELREN